MAGRNRMPSNRDGMGGPLAGAGILGSFGGQQPHVRTMFAQQQFDLQAGVNGPMIDQTIQAQQNEIRLILTENQHLAATHVALRQELLAAQQEGQRMQALLAGVQSEKDGQVRALLENSAKLEADLRATESLKVELQQSRFESKRYTSLMHEVNQQLRNANADLHRLRTEAQQIPALKAETENLRQEMQRTRAAYEYEKSLNSQYLEQKRLAEKNLVSMAREVESLRAELASLDRRGRLNPTGGYDGVPMTDNGYGRQQQVMSDEYSAAYGGQRLGQWGFETQRRSSLSNGRR